MWLFTGILIGLGLAWYLFTECYIPAPGIDRPVAGDTSIRQPSERAIAHGISTADARQEQPQTYLFSAPPALPQICLALASLPVLPPST